MELKGYIGGSYQSQSPLADNEQTWNWYPERLDQEVPDATTRMALYPTPGVKVISAGTGFPGSAHFFQDNREFAVVGTVFLEIASTGARQAWGTVATGSTPATICSNGKTGGQLMITAGTNVYIFTLATNAFAQIAAMNGLATMGDQLDGYFLALNSATGTVYFSNLNDGTTWQTGLNFFKRNIASDAWVAMKVANRFIWLFGSQTSEIWYDAGTFPLPFAPYTSSVVPYGCAAAFSPCVADGALLWLGLSKDGNGQVLLSPGFSPRVVSTFAMSNVIGNYGLISDAVGDTYTSLGHTFYLLSFPTANTTLCYDATTQLWHNRGTWSAMNRTYVSWRPRFHAFAFGQHRMLDSSTGAIYQMSETFTSDVDAGPIRRMRQGPGLFYQNQRLFINSFELYVEPGLGNAVDPGSNPQIAMSISHDGGKTFGTEHMRSSGMIGQYQARLRWNRCGQGRNTVFQVVSTDPVFTRVMGAFLTMRQPPLGLSQYAQAQWSS
jgi:hypothetical protein